MCIRDSLYTKYELAYPRGNDANTGPASPAARSGLGRSVHMPDAGSDAHEHARWQSVQWLGRDGRGCSGARRVPECAWARLPCGVGADGGPCPQKTCPGIGRMRRSNPRPDRRPTLVTAAVQPRSRRPYNHGVTHGPGAADPGTLPQSCLLYTSPSPRDQRGSRMPSSA